VEDLLTMSGDAAEAAGAWVDAAWAGLSAWAQGGGPYELLLAYWVVLQVTLIVTAIIIALSSLDDLFVDLCWWRLVIGGGFRRLFRKPPDQLRMRRHPEKRVALMVPAWKEAEVIASMVANTLSTFDYERYHIFVGVYANDPDTRREVERVQSRFPNVHMAVVPREGPTSKADCLNIIVQNVLAKEDELGEAFDVFLMHDAEDVVHPWGLKTVNWFIEGHGMIQLPVLSMNRRWYRMVACHYMDEFAEFHTKDLPVRTWLAKMTPSAGVATAFSREAMLALRAENDEQPFNTDSLTEDYDVAHRLRALGFTSQFVRYHAKVLRWRKARLRKGHVHVLRRELVATKEFFPDRFGAAVRQKARWMLGISYMGWRQLGWFGDAANRYFLFRDRKALITAPTGAIAYLIVLQYLGWAGVTWLVPQAPTLPPLIEHDWVWWIIGVNFLFLLNRLAHRALFTWLNHGKRHVWLTPVRVVVSNLIGFLAFARALRLFLTHLLTGKKIGWDKTTHDFPSFADMQRMRGRIGDLLRFWNHVDVEALDHAIAEQKRRYRPLGLLLVDRGALDDEHLAEAFAARDETAATLIDAWAVGPDLCRLVTERLSAICGVMPVALEDGRLDLAAAEPLSRERRALIERAADPLGFKSIRWLYAPLSDVAFALRFACRDGRFSRQRAEVGAMRAAGMIDGAAEARLWRAVRRQYARIGDLLVRMGAIEHRALQTALDEHIRTPSRLGDQLVAAGLVTPAQVQEALRRQHVEEIDMVQLARALDLIDDGQVRLMRRAVAEASQPEPAT